MLPPRCHHPVRVSSSLIRAISFSLFYDFCANPFVQTPCETPLCKPFVQTLCANPLCKPFVKTLCANPLWKPFVKTPHPHLSICYSFLNILLIYRYVTHFSISIKPGFFMFLFPGSLVPWFLGSLVPWFPGSLVPLKGSYASKRKDLKETMGFLSRHSTSKPSPEPSQEQSQSPFDHSSHSTGMVTPTCSRTWMAADTR